MKWFSLFQNIFHRFQLERLTNRNCLIAFKICNQNEKQNKTDEFLVFKRKQFCLSIEMIASHDNKKLMTKIWMPKQNNTDFVPYVIALEIFRFHKNLHIYFLPKCRMILVVNCDRQLIHSIQHQFNLVCNGKKNKQHAEIESPDYDVEPVRVRYCVKV